MKKGFTLLELLIVVVILGVLALIAAPALLNAADQARLGAVKANVNAAASSVTSRFALESAEPPSVVATNVVTALLDGGNTKNPMVVGNPAFDDAQAATAGLVSLVGNDAAGTVTITGHDKTGAIFITKTVAAPN